MVEKVVVMNCHVQQKVKVVYSNQVKYSTVRLLREIDALVQKNNSLVVKTHKILLIDWQA